MIKDPSCYGRQEKRRLFLKIKKMSETKGYLDMELLRHNCWKCR